jgi:hypothetical protein
MLFSITFSIPESKIVDNIPFKKKILSELVPGEINTYIYNTEETYYQQYQDSFFAITKKKAGWDCMRHYEIIANGCLPYFIDIENCPENTMALLPKDLFIQANHLYLSKFINKTIENLSTNTIDEYNLLVRKFLDHLKNHLTTKNMANYILQKTNHNNATKILYLSGNTLPDYLRCLLLHGFKELLGDKCHDFPIIPHLYNSYNQDNLYGNGFTYARLLGPELHQPELDTTILQDIENKYYDIVIYGSYHRGMPYYDLVRKHYQTNEIILLCGEDIHYCDNHHYLSIGHPIFIREL